MIQLISRLQSITHDTGDLADVRREIERAARLEARGERVGLAFSLSFRAVRPYAQSGRSSAGSVTLYQHGYSPARILQRVEESGSLHLALQSLANDKAGVSGARGLERVEMTLFPLASRPHK